MNSNDKEGSSMRKTSKESDSKQKLISKIDNLENIVKDLASKLENSQNVSQNTSLNLSRQKYSKSPIKGYNLDDSYVVRKNTDELETRRLRMELEQMRRCEKIAKENEMLYSRLVEDIKYSPNQTLSRI